MSTNFADILNKPSNEVEKPKPLPAGTYTAVVKGQPRFDKSQKKQTPFVEFTLGILAAGEDIDPDELKESLGETPLGDKTMKNTFYLTDTSLWRLKDFLEALGLDVNTDASLAQLIEETPGMQCTITIGHRASEDGRSMFAEIKNVSAA